MLLLAGCHRSGRRQAERVLAAAKRLDASEGADRAAALAELEGVETDLPAAVAARDACAKKHRGLLTAQELVASAKAAQQDERAGLVKAADEAIEQARAGFSECARDKEALRRWLKNH